MTPHGPPALLGGAGARAASSGLTVFPFPGHALASSEYSAGTISNRHSFIKRVLFGLPLARLCLMSVGKVHTWGFESLKWGRGQEHGRRPQELSSGPRRPPVTGFEGRNWAEAVLAEAATPDTYFLPDSIGVLRIWVSS